MSFAEFARAHGVEIPPDGLYASDRIRRCPTTEKPRSSNGAFFWDGLRGWVCNWSAGGEVHWYGEPNARGWTEEEKRAWAKSRQSAAVELSHRHARAAQQANSLLRSAVRKPHDYLVRKSLSNQDGLVLPEGQLMVPMLNAFTNELQGAQIIRWLPDERRWEKRMVTGMRAKGAVFRLGPRTATRTILCEGYATGLSLGLAVRQMRLNAAVLVCFSDSSLVHVASLPARGKRYVFADNDAGGAGERAARKTGLPFCMSPVTGEDANDMYTRAGLMPICELLMNTVHGEKPLP